MKMDRYTYNSLCLGIKITMIVNQTLDHLFLIEKFYFIVFSDVAREVAFKIG